MPHHNLLVGKIARIIARSLQTGTKCPTFILEIKLN